MANCCDWVLLKENTKSYRKKNKSTLWFVFLITNECNFRCTYCFEKNKINNFMTFETAKKLIDKMFDFSDYKDYWKEWIKEGDNVNDIKFEYFGGEPFLNPKLMEQISEYFLKKCDENPEKYAVRKNNFRADIITNGSLLNTPDSQHFLDNYLNHARVVVSFEGTKAYHDACRKYKDTGKGTFDDVLDNINWFRDRYGFLPNSPKITISPFNVQYMYEAMKNVYNIGYNSCYMKFVLDTPLWNNKHAEIADEQFKKITKYLLEHKNFRFTTFTKFEPYNSLDLYNFTGCGVNRGYTVIDTDGKFYPCYEFTEMTSSKEIAKKMCLGNVDSGIDSRKKKLMQTILTWNSKNKLDDDCRACTYSYWCASCAACNLIENNDITKRPKWDCKMLKVEQKWALIYNYLKEKGSNGEEIN